MPRYPIIISAFPDVLNSIRDLRLINTEECVCYYLKNNTILKKSKFSSQKQDALILNPRVLFKEMIDTDSTQILLLHNHPSNSCYPSQAELYSTERLVDLGRVFGYDLLDHIIITVEEYFSFEEAGILSKQKCHDVKI